MTNETILSPGPYVRLAAGTRLNGIYEIDRYITAGGMGEIYRGFEIVTRNPVAIKTIRPELARNETAAALFRKEASALFNLHHEAIVRYFIFSVDPALGIPYLAMEYVEGESLSDILRRGALDTARIGVLMRRLALGLEAAHGHGIVHRDLSPDNVLVPDGDMGKAKLIDFGIARSAVGGGTLIGSGFAGKMNYISPEQLGLYGGDVGPASDIYSLGLVVAEAVRGTGLDMGHSHVEVIDRRRRVPDLSSIDPQLRPILHRMLQPNPKDRPGSMAEVAAWLPKATRAGRGRSWALAAGGVAALAAGLGGAAYLTGLDLDGLRASLGTGPTAPAPPKTLASPKAPTPPETKSPVGEPGRAGEAVRNALSDPPPLLSPPPRDEPGPNGTAPNGEDRRPSAEAETATPAAPPPTEGRFGPDPRETTTLADLAPPRSEPPAPPPEAAPRPSTRQEASVERVRAFLRGYSGGRCFFITPVTLASKEANIEAFGSTPAPFMAFDEAFQRDLGFEPEINLRQVTPDQCPLVDYLVRLNGQRSAAKPNLSLKSDLLKSGDELVATADARADRYVEMLLISNDGGVHNLASHTKRAGDTLTARLRVVENERHADPQPQIVVALASPRPLSGPLAALKNGAAGADRFFKLLGDEAARTGAIGINVKYFKLRSPD